MNPRNLKSLIAIEDTGSFVRAAEALNMTLSAISMQMKSLEAELGVEIFDRQHRPPRITPMGRRVVAQARSIVDAYSDLASVCRDSDTLAGDIRVGFVLTASVRLLPKFLAQAPTRFPQARFLVETGLSHALAERVAIGTLDAAVITGGDLRQATLHHRVLVEEELVYCLPPQAGNWTIAHCMKDLRFIHFMPQAGIGRLNR